ncbi:MAG: sulfurtransferase complex subunit TusC [Halioglobus sp.]
MKDRKTLLVIVRQSPYGSSLARASLDTALAAAALDQPVSLLFLGDGVLQLLPDQHSEAIGVKNIGRLLGSLPLYDIESVYIDAGAAARYQLDTKDLVLPVKPVDPAAVRRLINDCDNVIGF